MSIELKDSPAYQAVVQALKLRAQTHARLRELHHDASLICRGSTLIKLAEAIAALESEIEEFEGCFGELPKGILKYSYSPDLSNKVKD